MSTMKYRKNLYLWPLVPALMGGVFLAMAEPWTTLWWTGWCAESFAAGMCLVGGWGVEI